MILKDNAYGSQVPGSVKSCLIIPDFTQNLKIEAKIQDLKDLKMLMSVETPFMSCCIPSMYKNQDKYEQAMENYENELFEETMKSFVNSGHAFVCFDSVTSLNIILKHFQPTPLQNLKIFFSSVKTKLNDFGRWITRRDSVGQHSEFDSQVYRGRSKSNFLAESVIDIAPEVSY